MKLKHLVLLTSLVIAACATGGPHRLKSLQHYVGQTTAQVRSQFVLSKMGFKAT